MDNFQKSTLGGLLNVIAERHPHNVALIHDGEEIAYATLRSLVHRAAASLLSLGVKRGDIIANLMSNRPEWLVTCLAAAKIGALFAPINTWYRRREIQWALRDLGAVAVFSEARFLKHDYASDLAAILPELRESAPGELRSSTLPALRCVTFLGSGYPGAFSWEEFMDLGKAASPAAVDDTESAVREEDPAIIIHTSGSTGEPKRMLFRHGWIVQNGFNIGERRTLESSDRVWLGSPLFYALGVLNAVPATFSHGATLVLQGHFEAGKALDVIERHECTAFYGMSNMIRAIFEHRSYHKRRVASLSKGTAGISPAERRILIEEMGATLATQSYGLTEVYANCTGGFVDDSLETKLTTAGASLPGFDLKVVDPESRSSLPNGKVGLLLVHGFIAEDYQPSGAVVSITDDDGYLNTGDLGSIGEDGYFRFHSRWKELIKTGGINVAPLEVEKILLEHPLVRQAYVVGVPHPTKGEILVAFIESARSMNAGEIQGYMRDRAASFKIPTHVLFRKESQLPRLSSGKVPRFKLREQAIVELGEEE